MARGGVRPGGGRPRLTAEEKAASVEARKAARRVADKAKAAAAKKVAKSKPQPNPKAKAAPKPKTAGYSPTGKKSADAPPGWPFGTEDPPPPPPPPPAPVDPDAEPVIEGGEPLDFLQRVIDEKRLKLAVRMQAAALAVAYKHAKPAPMGKKEAKQEAAKKVSRFAALPLPKLVVNNPK